jgi:hypothetical protein
LENREIKAKRERFFAICGFHVSLNPELSLDKKTLMEVMRKQDVCLIEKSIKKDE